LIWLTISSRLTACIIAKSKEKQDNLLTPFTGIHIIVTMRFPKKGHKEDSEKSVNKKSL
jgi:hypothetical protein